MKRYVIIGNGAATIGAVEGIRRLDSEGPITIISSEPYHTYARPLISYYIEGKTDRERMKYRPDDFYEKNGCEFLAGKTAVKIDPAAKSVTLDDGSVVSYDKLCYAAGSSSFIPAFRGLETVSESDRFTFMTLDDAERLKARIEPGLSVLIVGAGLIGLKCAECIYGKVGAITVVDLAPRILSSILEEKSASIVQRHLEGKGLNFILNDSVDEFHGHIAIIKSGIRQFFDIVVLAVGVRPNVALMKEAGARVNRGVSTDRHMYTGVDGIYAAGDCTETFDVSCGETRILALMPNAYMQGECAGINMAGGDCDFENAVPMNAIKLLGLHISTAGSYIGDVIERENTADRTYTRFYVDGGLLRGYIMLGEPYRNGIYTSIIRNQIPIDKIDFETLIKSPSISAMGESYICQLERKV